MSEKIAHTPETLTTGELSLAKWLAQEEFSQYGECYGATLDGLVEKGFAKIHEAPEGQAGFIARGRSKMHCAVSLTDAGRAAIRLATEGSQP